MNAFISTIPGTSHRTEARKRMDARKMREGGPTVFAQVKNGVGVDDIVTLILSAWKASGAEEVAKANGGPRPTDGLEELEAAS